MCSAPAPCPWCEDGGKPFPVIHRQPGFTVAISCHVCHAEGPKVKFDPNYHRLTWDEIVAEAKERAWERWNERAARPEVGNIIGVVVDAA